MNRTPITLDAIRNTPAGRLPSNAHLFEKKGSKRAKYGNVKVELDGIMFDSQKEAARYIVLRAMYNAGEIQHLHCHVVFELSVCKYISDFSYIKDGALIVEDVKSKMTRRLAVYRLKKKLMKEEKNIEIIEV